MNKLILVLLIVASMVRTAEAQCCGDCNGDGMVTINELITAVNNALGGCASAIPTPGQTSTPTHRPSATPTVPKHCPLALTDNSHGNGCTFNGRYNLGCGTALNSLLTSNGVQLIVAIDTMLQPPQAVLYFAAHVDSATSASLTAWSTDGFQTGFVTAGSVQLTDNGTQLVIFPNNPPLMIRGCNFVQYTGAYVGRSGSEVARADTANEPDSADALDRLRIWLERPLPDIAEPQSEMPESGTAPR